MDPTTEERVSRDELLPHLEAIRESTASKVERMVILLIDTEGHPGVMGVCWMEDCSGNTGGNPPHSMSEEAMMGLLTVFVEHA